MVVVMLVEARGLKVGFQKAEGVEVLRCVYELWTERGGREGEF